jgi:hypothetical protein
MSQPDDLEAAREQARRDFAAEQQQQQAMRRGYARGRARDEAIRAGLQPLGPDERPLGLLLAIALVVVVCGANAILAVGDDHLAAAAAFAVAGVALAAGLWARIYLVVVLVEALLAIGIIFAAIALLFAGTVAQAAFAIAVIVLSAPVFWLLVRVMARLQVPRR